MLSERLTSDVRVDGVGVQLSCVGLSIFRVDNDGARVGGPGNHMFILLCLSGKFPGRVLLDVFPIADVAVFPPASDSWQHEVSKTAHTSLRLVKDFNLQIFCASIST